MNIVEKRLGSKRKKKGKIKKKTGSSKKEETKQQVVLMLFCLPIFFVLKLAQCCY